MRTHTSHPNYPLNILSVYRKAINTLKNKLFIVHILHKLDNSPPIHNVIDPIFNLKKGLPGTDESVKVLHIFRHFDQIRQTTTSSLTEVFPVLTLVRNFLN
ncbi:ORF150 [White spot syndrome virus]|uniref:ORF150 n=1 Tax=White spot syndrome virus TaxID=342409 RepID=A0A2D3I5I9_9VIRU|nr:ORF150 [White spot syndrome virus]